MKIIISFVLTALLLLAGCNDTTINVPSYYGAEPPKDGEGEARLPDSGHYKGGFKNGLFNGQGVITWSNGDQYEGEFKDGLMHGHGVSKLPDGSVYTGEYVRGLESGHGKLKTLLGEEYKGGFKNGLFDGEGTYVAANGNIFNGTFNKGGFTGSGVLIAKSGASYSGDFVTWEFDGEGVYTLENGDIYTGHFASNLPDGEQDVKYAMGDHYKGGMKDWKFHGDGLLVSSNGFTYIGKFEQGMPVGVMKISETNGGEVYEGKTDAWRYNGQGKLKRADGSSYEGGFQFGVYAGKGVLTSADGKRYEGEFEAGFYHGMGTLDYTDSEGELISLSGPWNYGNYAGDDAADYIKDGLGALDIEQLLYDQPKMVNKALAVLTPEVPGKPDLYFVSFGSYGGQDVFMKEVHHSVKIMDQLYKVGGRTIPMINNLKTIVEAPLATAVNLQHILNGIAQQMDVEEDLLFLYLTSHGSKTYEISISLPGVPLQNLSINRFKSIIDESGIKWKVLVVSSCYSGGVIDMLRDDHTLIMTAARSDRKSFGCGDEEDLTYFGRAYFEKSLNAETGFIAAFENAKKLIAGWEKNEEKEASEPQISSTKAIEEKLAEWRRLQKSDG